MDEEYLVPEDLLAFVNIMNEYEKYAVTVSGIIPNPALHTVRTDLFNTFVKIVDAYAEAVNEASDIEDLI